MEDYIDKKFKADYLGYQVKFIDQLKYISSNLKMIEQKQRPEVLREKLAEVNGWINETVRSKVDTIETDCKFNYLGIVLPFEEGDDQNPRMVVNILEELAQPFNTKKRAPFKIAFETVTLQEMKERNMNLIKKELQQQAVANVAQAFTELNVTEAENPFSTQAELPPEEESKEMDLKKLKSKEEAADDFMQFKALETEVFKAQKEEDFFKMDQ